jgi:hypothetical protein
MIYFLHIDTFVSQKLSCYWAYKQVFNFSNPFYEEVEKFLTKFDILNIFVSLNIDLNTAIFFSGIGGLYTPGHFLTSDSLK